MNNFLFPIMMLSATDYYLGQGGAFRKKKFLRVVWATHYYRSLPKSDLIKH